MSDERELLTKEEIAKEKADLKAAREGNLEREIEEIVTEYERIGCNGRLGGKKHYMRKVELRAFGYDILCEFCDIPKICVRGFDVEAHRFPGANADGWPIPVRSHCK